MTANGRQNGRPGGDSDASDSDGDGLASELKKWRALDDVSALRMRLQRAVRAAEVILYAEGSTTAERLTAISRLTAAVREHRKTIEAHELEQRLDRLEDVTEQFLTTRNGHE